MHSFQCILIYFSNSIYFTQGKGLCWSIIWTFQWLVLFFFEYGYTFPFSFLKSFCSPLGVDKQCIQYFRWAGYDLKSLLAGLFHSSQLSSFSSVWFFTFLFYFFELTHYHLGYFYAIIRFISFYNSWVVSYRQFFKPNY